MYKKQSIDVQGHAIVTLNIVFGTKFILFESQQRPMLHNNNAWHNTNVMHDLLFDDISHMYKEKD